jgi:hypothetical protein
VPSTKRHGAILAALLVAWGVPGAGGAQEESPSHAEAIARFQEGTRLVTQGDCVAASAKFRQSLALEAGIGAHLDLADCEERLGAAEAAWRDFRLAERLASARRDDRAGLAHDRAQRLEQRLLIVHVPPAEGLELVLDGQRVDPELFADGALAVTPGAHQFEGRLPGREPFTLGVSGDAQQVKDLVVPPKALPEAASPATAAAPGATQRALGLLTMGVGALGLVVGTVTGVITVVEHGDAVRACGGTYPRCDPPNPNALTSANGTAETAGTLSTVSFVVAGLAIAGGAAIYLTTPRAEKSAALLRVAPMVGPGAPGATLVGSF